MSMLKRKKVTFEDRVNSLTTAVDTALSTFRHCADQLESVADDLDVIRDEANAEIKRLCEVEGYTLKAADANRSRAAKIRGLIG